jgi:hypothetical protein
MHKCVSITGPLVFSALYGSGMNQKISVSLPHSFAVQVSVYEVNWSDDMQPDSMLLKAASSVCTALFLCLLNNESADRIVLSRVWIVWLITYCDL